MSFLFQLLYSLINLSPSSDATGEQAPATPTEAAGIAAEKLQSGEEKAADSEGATDDEKGDDSKEADEDDGMNWQEPGTEEGGEDDDDAVSNDIGED